MYPKDYGNAYAITPSNITELVFRALYMGGTGHIFVQKLDGTNQIIRNVPTGAILPIEGRKVLSTSTTATNIVGLT